MKGIAATAPSRFPAASRTGTTSCAGSSFAAGTTTMSRCFSKSLGAPKNAAESWLPAVTTTFGRFSIMANVAKKL